MLIPLNNDTLASSVHTFSIVSRLESDSSPILSLSFHSNTLLNISTFNQMMGRL